MSINPQSCRVRKEMTWIGACKGADLSAGGSQKDCLSESTLHAQGMQAWVRAGQRQGRKGVRPAGRRAYSSPGSAQHAAQHYNALEHAFPLIGDRLSCSYTTHCNGLGCVGDEHAAMLALPSSSGAATWRGDLAAAALPRP